MLTENEKEILRYLVRNKTPDEMKSIGLSDDLARQEIAAFVAQQKQILPKQVNAMANQRDSIQEEIDKLTQLQTLLD